MFHIPNGEWNKEGYKVKRDDYEKRVGMLVRELLQCGANVAVVPPELPPYPDGKPRPQPRGTCYVLNLAGFQRSNHFHVKPKYRSRVDWLRGSTWPVSGTRKGYLVGTHRAITPEETVARAEHFARALGITRVADVTRLDTIGLPVVVVHRPNARSLSVSQGKGITLAAAKASGLMEAIELHHAEHITLPVRFASLDDLRSTHDLVDVTALPRLSVGHFHADLRLLWIEGVNLLNDAPLWLPYELVHTDFTLPFPPGSGCFVNSSNGLASGNRRVEALVHAICEVVERDATTLWHMAGASGEAERRFDPGSIDDPLCAEVLALFEAADVAVGIWETTSDVGVAAFFCTIVDREPRSWRQLYPSSGAGCHPNRSIALLRALTEGAQSRLTLISGSRDDQPRADIRPGRTPTRSNGCGGRSRMHRACAGSRTCQPSRPTCSRMISPGCSIVSVRPS